MARFNHSPLTRAVNKLGGIVFQQYDGMQIGREYQPNVKNPRTVAQTENRMRFKLASQLNALLAPLTDIIQKANGIQYERFQRGENLRLLYRKTYIDSIENDARIAILPMYRTSNPTGVTLSVSAAQATPGSPVVVTFTRDNTVGEVKGIVQIANLDDDGSRGSSTRVITFEDGAATTTLNLTGGDRFRSLGIVAVLTPETTDTGVIGITDISPDKIVLAALNRIVSVTAGSAMSNSAQIVTHYSPA